MEKIVSPKFTLFLDIVLSITLSLFVASLYFSNPFVISANILFISVSVILIMYMRFYKKQKLSTPKPVVYCWLLVYLVRGIWLLVSDNRQYGLGWLDTCLPFILFPIIFQWLPLNERIIKIVLTFFVRISFVFCAVTLGFAIYAIKTLPLPVEEWLRAPKAYHPLAYVWTNYGHPSFLCVIYLLALPIGLYLNRTYRTISSVEWLFLLVAETAVIMFTGARVGMIILPIMLFLMMLYITPRGRKMVAIATMIGFVAFSGLMMLSSAESFQGRFKDAYREQLLKTAIYSIKEKPLMGVGTGGMRSVINSPEIAEKLDYPEAPPFSYPHNQYLGEIMQFGFIGAIALFGTLLYLLFLAFWQRNFLLQSLLLIITIFMFTEMPFDSNKGINFLLFFISLFMLMQNRQKALLN